MSEFDPAQPAIVREQRTGKIVTWTGDLAAQWIAHSTRQTDGSVEFRGVIYDGWVAVLGG